MPNRRLDDREQAEIAPTAGDLGLEAYREETLRLGDDYR